MEVAPPVLVIKRSAEQERRIQRDGLIVITSQACNVALCLGISIFLTQKEIDLPQIYTLLPLVASCFGLYAMYGQLRWRTINKRLRNLQLCLTKEGVTYESDAGRFSAPWSRVRRVRLQGHGLSVSYLIIDVRDWGGPIGRAGRLTMPIHDCGIKEQQIKRAIHQLSGGAITTIHR